MPNDKSLLHSCNVRYRKNPQKKYFHTKLNATKKDLFHVRRIDNIYSVSHYLRIWIKLSSCLVSRWKYAIWRTSLLLSLRIHGKTNCNKIKMDNNTIVIRKISIFVADVNIYVSAKKKIKLWLTKFIAFFLPYFSISCCHLHLNIICHYRITGFE